jgi:hypothetical protein
MAESMTGPSAITVKRMHTGTVKMIQATGQSSPRSGEFRQQRHVYNMWNGYRPLPKTAASVAVEISHLLAKKIRQRDGAARLVS